MSDLLDRLRKVESGPTRHPGVATNWHRNPDGPEAATEIERLRARLEERNLDWLCLQEQVKNQSARLVEAERLLLYADCSRGWYDRRDAFLTADSAADSQC